MDWFVFSVVKVQGQSGRFDQDLFADGQYPGALIVTMSVSKGCAMTSLKLNWYIIVLI